MANINLSSEGIREKSPMNVGRKGTVTLVLILFLIIATYGGELIYGEKLTKDISQLQNEYKSSYGNLSEGNFLIVADFQNRLNIAKAEIDEGKNIRENLAEIEKLITPGVYLSSYKYTKKDNTILLGCVGDNYNLAAKQILSFKKSTWFSDASGGETSLDSELGKVNFKVNLKLK
jgi:hypothetical protein